MQEEQADGGGHVEVGCAGRAGSGGKRILEVAADGGGWEATAGGSELEGAGKGVEVVG